MGKQVNKDLHRKAKQLYARMPEAFTTDFDKNKKAMTELHLQIPKTEKNIIAGLLVKLATKKEL